MRGIEGREKCYVSVVSRTEVDGRVVPLKIVWEDGRTFTVDKVLDCRQAVSRKVGGTGLRYTIRVHNESTYLWYERPRWFVEGKVRPRSVEP